MLTSISSAMLAEFGSKWQVCTEDPGDVMSSFRAVLSQGGLGGGAVRTDPCGR